MTEQEFKTYRLLKAIEAQTLLSKLPALGDMETLPETLLLETAALIVWDESPQMKLAIAFGVPIPDRRSFLSDGHENRHDQHLKTLIYKYARIINKLIEEGNKIVSPINTKQK